MTCHRCPTPSNLNGSIVTKLSEEHVALLLFLVDHLVVLVDDGDAQKNASTAADGAEEICDDGEHSDAHATESRCCWDVHVEHMK